MTRSAETSTIGADDVRVFALSRRDGPGYRKTYKSPYVVKWSVGRSQRSRSFRTQREADRWRSKLVQAVATGETFDLTCGLPVKWVPPVEREAVEVKSTTFLAHCIDHVAAKWARWAPKSRCAAVEALVIACTTLTDGDMPLKIQGPARSWLLHCALTPRAQPAKPAEVAASNWLIEHSLELTDLKAKHVEATLVAMGRRLDGGGAVVSTTLSRRRNVLNHCLKLAERDELLVRNPLSTIDKSALPPVKTMDPAAIPDLLQGHALIDYIDGEVTAPGGHGDYIRAVRHRYATF
jgi:hypothetical protein